MYSQTVVTERRPFTICWLAWCGGGGGLRGTMGVLTPYAGSSTSRFLEEGGFRWDASRVAEVFLLLEWSRHSAWWRPFSRVLGRGGGGAGSSWGRCTGVA